MTNQQTELDQAIPVRTRSPHALTLWPRGLTRELRLGHKGNATRLQVIPRMQSIVAVGAQVACAHWAPIAPSPSSWQTLFLTNCEPPLPQSSSFTFFVFSNGCNNVLLSVIDGGEGGCGKRVRARRPRRNKPHSQREREIGLGKTRHTRVASYTSRRRVVPRMDPHA